MTKSKAAPASAATSASASGSGTGSGSAGSGSAGAAVVDDSALAEKVRKLKAAGFSDELIAKMTKSKAASGSASASASGSGSGGSETMEVTTVASRVLEGADHFSVRSDRGSDDESNGDKFFKESLDKLMSSYRNSKCKEYVARTKGHHSSECELSRGGRVTAAPLATSKQKLGFDIRQLQYIAGKSKDTKLQNTIKAVVGNLKVFQESVVSDKMTILPAAKGRSVDGLLYVVENKVDPFYTHQEGIEYGKSSVSLIGKDQNDFIVLDGILLEHTRKVMISMLLSSTIWHDVSSGQAFISHSDDTLIYSAFFALGKELEQMLELAVNDSRNDMPKLSRYYAVAMESSENARSAISAGNQDEYHVVVFLNNPTSPASTDESGMRIFSDEYTACLHHHGAALSPRVHPEFLSTLGSLAVELHEDCNMFHSEVVPRETNRVVVISPKETFRFENRHDDKIDSKADAKTFAKSTQLAIVYMYE